MAFKYYLNAILNSECASFFYVRFVLRPSAEKCTFRFENRRRFVLRILKVYNSGDASAIVWSYH
ncbi:MAG: hypothetical protein LBU37_09540, partial [Tannerellaceae bacterium]|nr:hypothetical protein [Tannerellaceae bacterium]